MYRKGRVWWAVHTPMELLGFAYTSQLFVNTHIVLGSEEGFDIPSLTQGRPCHPMNRRHWVLVTAVTMSTIHIHLGLAQFPTPCLKRLRLRMILVFSRTHPISYSGLLTGMQRDLSLNPSGHGHLLPSASGMGTGRSQTYWTPA